MRFRLISSLAVLGALGWFVLYCLHSIETGESGAKTKDSGLDAGLFVAAERLSLGDLWEDTRFKWLLPIQNRGDKDVDVDTFFASCMCVTTQPRRLLIPAGESRTLELTLDLTPQPSKRPPTTWPFEVRLQPAILGPRGNFIFLKGWELHGTVRRVLSLPRYQLDFGKHSERSQPLPAQPLAITSLGSLRGIAAECGSMSFQAEVKPVRGSNSRFELTISPKGIVPIGAHQFEVHVIAELAMGQKVTSRGISVTAEVVSDIQPSPPVVHFGPQTVGEMCEESVTLSSMTVSPFKVVGYLLEASGVAVQADPQQGAGAIFQIRQRIVRGGHQSGSILFQVETCEGAMRDVKVPIQYYGKEAPSPRLRDR